MQMLPVCSRQSLHFQCAMQWSSLPVSYYTDYYDLCVISLIYYDIESPVLHVDLMRRTWEEQVQSILKCRYFGELKRVALPGAYHSQHTHHTAHKTQHTAHSTHHTPHHTPHTIHNTTHHTIYTTRVTDVLSRGAVVLWWRRRLQLASEQHGENSHHGRRSAGARNTWA